jgi:branched-chain amino acid transport system ATP-binding protein
MHQLELRGVSRSFGELKALSGLDLVASRGERKAVIGPNGAGKTTLFNLISGLLPPTSGDILFNGQSISHLPSHVIATRGIGRSFQITRIFGRMTVFDSVLAAVLAKSRHAWNMIRPFGRLPEAYRRAHELLDAVGLSDRREQPSRTLSHGDQRLLDLALALAGDPELLLLDEPTAGMSPTDTRRVAELIPAIVGDRTVLLIEHDMEVVMSIATSVVVLARGTKLAEGTPSEVQANAQVQEAYLGGVI